MTLAEKIVKELRKSNDSGLTSAMLALILSEHTPEKIEAAAQMLQEQEHLIRGNDNCWYLGDALAQGGNPAPSAKPTAASSTEEKPKKPTPSPAPVKKTASDLPELKEPIRIRMKNWVLQQPESAKPISWSALGKILNAKRSAMGKARVNLLERGDIEVVARLDRLVYREDSVSYRQRAQLGIDDIGVAVTLKADLEEVNARLQAPPPPPKWREYRGALLEMDKMLAQHLQWPENRPLRKTLKEVCEWLEQVGGQL